MKFGIHNPSWLFGPDPAEVFEAVKAKAQWAENHGFVWFSVMDHLIQIGGVGAPDVSATRPSRVYRPERWAVAEPMVRGLSAGGRWIRTFGSARKGPPI